MKITGQLVDIHRRNIYPAIIRILEGRIQSVENTNSASDIYILPRLTDSHVHIESSMITQGAFAMAAVKHGTCGMVSDLH